MQIRKQHFNSEESDVFIYIETASCIYPNDSGNKIKFYAKSTDSLDIDYSDGIVLRSEYLKSIEDRIYIITKKNASYIEAEPLSADGNTVTPSQIMYVIPIGTILNIKKF
jgi:hypothetical protein